VRKGSFATYIAYLDDITKRYVEKFSEKMLAPKWEMAGIWGLERRNKPKKYNCPTLSPNSS